MYRNILITLLSIDTQHASRLRATRNNNVLNIFTYMIFYIDDLYFYEQFLKVEMLFHRCVHT